MLVGENIINFFGAGCYRGARGKKAFPQGPPRLAGMVSSAQPDLQEYRCRVELLSKTTRQGRLDILHPPPVLFALLSASVGNHVSDLSTARKRQEGGVRGLRRLYRVVTTCHDGD